MAILDAPAPRSGRPSSDPEAPPPTLPGGIPRRVARARGESARGKTRLRRSTLETLGVFLLAYAFYLVVGYQLTVVQHLTVFDSLARLAHGYFVWWNDPPKLAAIGFVWAPISTMVFLPFTLIKPVATSLMALPATSGFFTALTMAVLCTGLRGLGWARWARLLLVAAFALNPLVVFYAINGMSEGPFIALLTISVVLFARWHESDASHLLPLSAVAMALAVLCRYELIVFAAVLGLAIPIVLYVRRRSGQEIEGTWLIYLVPIVFGLELWIFFNWLIIGDPLFWLKQQLGIGGDTLSGSGVASATAGGQGASATSAKGPLGVVLDVLLINWKIFPPLVIAPPILFVLAVLTRHRPRAGLQAQRHWLFVWIGLLCLANAMTTTLYFLYSRGDNLLQLRYNMRGIAVAVFALGLIVAALPKRWKPLGSMVAILLVAASIPMTWNTMRTYPNQYLEKVFVQAVSTGDDVENAATDGAYTVGVGDDREMADYITANVPMGRRSILTDDGQSFGVMLTSGRPDLFWDRIDLGDRRWLAAVDRPWGKVRFILVARYPLPPFEITDEIQQRFPALRLNQLPGISVEHANQHYVLLRVAAKRPRVPASRFEKVVDAVVAGRVPRL